MLEIRFHGRGGQGAVTASKILALAAFNEGKYVISFPFFGTERRGAPVTSFTRIDDKRIFLRTQIYEPDGIVILDQSIIGSTDVMAGLKKDGFLVINSRKSPGELGLDHRVVTVDATSIAIKQRLGNRANPIVNTAILGAFARANRSISLDSIVEATKTASPKNGDRNAMAVMEAYDLTKVGR